MHILKIKPTNTHYQLKIKNRVLVKEITISANQKDTIIFNITSDQRGIVHLHGYNIEILAKKEMPTVFSLEATTTGKFAIALHVNESNHDHEESGNASNHKDYDHEEIVETHLGYLEIWSN